VNWTWAALGAFALLLVDDLLIRRDLREVQRMAHGHVDVGAPKPLDHAGVEALIEERTKFLISHVDSIYAQLDDHQKRLTMRGQHINTLRRALEEQIALTIKTAQRANALMRYMRTALAAGEAWANEHERKVAKLDKVAHGHEEMRKR